MDQKGPTEPPAEDPECEICHDNFHEGEDRCRKALCLIAINTNVIASVLFDFLEKASATESCVRCNATGQVYIDEIGTPGYNVDCTACNGSGQIRR